MNPKISALFLFLVLCLAGCASSGPDIATAVHLTVTSLPSPTNQPTLTPRPSYTPFPTSTSAPLLYATRTPSPKASQFELLAEYRGVGGVLDSLVGPAKQAGKEWIYLSYTYKRLTFDLVAVDPEDGTTHIFENPTDTEWGAWALARGKEDDLYLGTLPSAKILRLEPATGKFTDFGSPLPAGGNIWQLTFASDGMLYGIVSPGNRLIRCDPEKKTVEDLGETLTDPQINRFLAADDDGFIYIGYGDANAQIVAVELSSGERRQILSQEMQKNGSAVVRRHTDGNVYASIAGDTFLLSRFKVEPATADIPAPVSRTNFGDGRSFETRTELCSSVTGENYPCHKVDVHGPASGQVQTIPVAYSGRAVPIFRLAGTQQGIYGGSIMPAYIFHYNPLKGILHTMASAGDGEIYAILPLDDAIIVGGYATNAGILLYKPFQETPTSTSPTVMPVELVEGLNTGWRPNAILRHENGKVYLGATASYGGLDGWLVEFDPDKKTFKKYIPVPNQSIGALTIANGLIVGGTSIHGGGDTNPVAEAASLFIWDPASQKTVFKLEIESGADSIYNLIAARNGLVYGFADDRMFVFDPQALRIVSTIPLIFPHPVSNSLVMAADGQIWGLASNGIFRIRTDTNTIEMAVQFADGIDSGVALDGDFLYFGSAAKLYRYRIY